MTTDLVAWDLVSPASTAPRRDAREATLRSFGRPGRGYWLLLAALTAVVAVGAVAWVVQLRRGLGAAGYSDHAFWAIYIADVVTFIGVSYGGAVISAILRLTGADWRAPLSRLAEGTAVVTVLIGGAFIIPHLGRPDRILELLYRPNLSSPIFWDFVAVAIYTIGSIVFFALPLVPDMAILHGAHPDRLGRRSRLYAAVSRGWVGAPPQRRVLNGAMGLIAIMIIPLAVSVHSVLSWAFALVSRPWWHESIWAPYFVVAALYSGVALVILVLAGFRRAYHLEHLITERHFVRLGFILAAFAAAYLYLTFADILPAAYVGEQGPSIVFQELLVGRFAVWFWMFVAAAGVLPLLLVALPATRTVTGMVVAAAFVVPAMWLKRMIMVVDPSTYDQMTHTFGVYHFTWISVSITLAGAAAIPLLLMLLFRVVPLLAIDEIEELAGTGGKLTASADGHRPVTASADGHRPVTASADGHRRTRRRWVFRSAGAATAVLLAGAVGLAGPTHASAKTPEPPPAVVTLTGAERPDGIHLTATVTDSRGTPLPGAKVEFFEITTAFGPQGQQVSLGSVVTDGGGLATLTDQPTITGARRYAAGYRGGEQAGSASANIEVQVKVAHPAYQPAPAKPLATVGKGLVGVLLTTVVLVLITLAAQVVRVVRVCRGGLHVGGSRPTTR